MNLLGIDTSTAASAAAVLRDDGEAFEHEPAPARLTEPPAHAAELMTAVHRVMSEAGLDYSDLDAVAVGVGPGAFTGLRIGVATARALAMGAGLELRPVSSLAALAHGSEAELALPVIDARRGEVFAALYQGREELWPAEPQDPAELAQRVAASGLQPLAVGDGSVRFRDVLEAAGMQVAAPGSRAHVVRGLSICRLALDAPPAVPQAVLPQYLREPDAKPRSTP
jgi:tRNA threonylcarbamoyladenosine biosynthesis protein TsaB